MCPSPWATSSAAHAQARARADGRAPRMGPTKHQTPKATRETLKMMKPTRRSAETSPLTKRAGGKTAERLGRDSSVECAAWASTRARNARRLERLIAMLRFALCVRDHDDVAVGILDSKLTLRGVERRFDRAGGDARRQQLFAERRHVVAVRIEENALLRWNHRFVALRHP